MQSSSYNDSSIADEFSEGSNPGNEIARQGIQFVNDFQPPQEEQKINPNSERLKEERKTQSNKIELKPQFLLEEEAKKSPKMVDNHKYATQVESKGKKMRAGTN